jgi:hypothetical protein
MNVHILRVLVDAMFVSRVSQCEVRVIPVQSSFTKRIALQVVTIAECQRCLPSFVAGPIDHLAQVDVQLLVRSSSSRLSGRLFAFGAERD